MLRRSGNLIYANVCKHGIRGGVNQINKLYVRANDKYIDEDFDPTKEKTYLLYSDGKRLIT